MKVLRTDVARMLFFQLLAPIMVSARVAARRWGNPTFLIGRRELEVIHGRVRLGDIELGRADVNNWTLDENVARVYGP